MTRRAQSLVHRLGFFLRPIVAYRSARGTVTLSDWSADEQSSEASVSEQLTALSGDASIRAAGGLGAWTWHR